MLYIIKTDYFLASYLLDDLSERSDITVLEHKKKKNSLLTKISREIQSHFATKKISHLNKDYIDQLRKIGPTDHVVFFAVENLKEIIITKRYINSDNITVWLWNPISKIQSSPKACRNYCNKLKSLGVNVASFDTNDCQQYNLQFLNQIYKYPTLDISQTCDTDVMFVGADKGRYEQINSYEQQLNQLGISTEFHVIADKRASKKNSHSLPRKLLTYEETLRITGRSKAIFEVMQKNQAGLTLRALEALFLCKKLITDNRHIKDYPFYNKNNIFILGEDSFELLPQFLAAPYIAIDQAIIDQYTVDTWVKNFI